MTLRHRQVKSNEVRVPEVPRGEVVIVGREDDPKVALVNPEDLAAFEESHALIESLASLETLPTDALAFRTRAIEDLPDPQNSIEDPDAIKALLRM